MTLPKKAVEAESSGEAANRTLSGPEKVAAILLSIDKALAGRLLKRLEEGEVKLIAQTASDLGQLSKERIDSIIEDFARTLKSGTDLNATVDQVKDLLATVLPADRIADIMTELRVTGSAAVWGRLAEVPQTTSATYLAREHPQVAALVLARTPPGYAAAVMQAMPVRLQKEIARRMLATSPVLKQPRMLLEEVLAIDVVLAATRNTTVSTHAKVADIINKMDRREMDATLQGLDEFSRKDADMVRKNLFTFEDIARLTKAGRVALFDAVPADTITIALHGAAAALIEFTLEAVPSRARRMIESELERGVAPKTKEVNKARRAIADLALEMVERGIVELEGPREDDSGPEIIYR